MKRGEVIREIEAYIDLISGPMSERNVEDGWDPESQQAVLQMMREIQKALRESTPVPKWSLVRSMDALAVRGELFDRACEISNHIRKMEE